MQQHLKQPIGSQNAAPAAPAPSGGGRGGKRGGAGRGDGGRARGTVARTPSRPATPGPKGDRK
eukprot:2827502-Prorocentrum_lima.AAC.1